MCEKSPFTSTTLTNSEETTYSTSLASTDYEQMLQGFSEFGISNEDSKVLKWLENNNKFFPPCEGVQSRKYEEFCKKFTPPSTYETRKYLDFVKSNPFELITRDQRRRAHRRRMMINRHQQKTKFDDLPPPVYGRRHADAQTGEGEGQGQGLDGQTINDKETQTNFYSLFPFPRPHIVHAKIGIDAGTEIPDGELFNFEKESRSIVNVLVDGALEQTKSEVLHRDEMLQLRQLQDDFTNNRQKDRQTIRRLEVEESKILAERDRRLQQSTVAMELDDEMQAEQTVRKLLAGEKTNLGLVTQIIDNADSITDELGKEPLTNEMCLWMGAKAKEEIQNVADSNDVLVAFINNIVKERSAAYIAADHLEQSVAGESVKDEIVSEEQDAIDCTCDEYQ